MEQRIFGARLEDIPLVDGLPLPVRDTILFLQQNNLLVTEGIFRVSGNHTKVNEIKQLYNTQRVVDLEAYDVHTVASVLKVFFRELPESLVTEENTDLFLVNIEMESQGVPNTIGKMRDVLKEFPPVYFDVLKALIGFLVKVASFSNDNKMNSHNLALIFGPNIFNHQEPLDMVRPDNPACFCTKYFIDHFDEIFMDLDINPPLETCQITTLLAKPTNASPTHAPPPNKPLPPIPTKKPHEPETMGFAVLDDD